MQRQLAERELTAEGPRCGGKAARRGRTVTVNLAESPLSWLHARGHIDRRLFDAGERLRMDYETAQLSPSITMRWDALRVDGRAGAAGLTQGERQLAAKVRFDQAMAEAGPGLSDILWRVVCAGDALPDAERLLSWPARSGKLVLKLALERVARFYRIS